jgi:hypothetical protein
LFYFEKSQNPESTIIIGKQIRQKSQDMCHLSKSHGKPEVIDVVSLSTKQFCQSAITVQTKTPSLANKWKKAQLTGKNRAKTKRYVSVV